MLRMLVAALYLNSALLIGTPAFADDQAESKAEIVAAQNAEFMTAVERFYNRKKNTVEEMIARLHSVAPKEYQTVFEKKSENFREAEYVVAKKSENEIVITYKNKDYKITVVEADRGRFQINGKDLVLKENTNLENVFKQTEKLLKELPKVSILEMILLPKAHALKITDDFEIPNWLIAVTLIGGYLLWSNSHCDRFNKIINNCQNLQPSDIAWAKDWHFTGIGTSLMCGQAKQQAENCANSATALNMPSASTCNGTWTSINNGTSYMCQPYSSADAARRAPVKVADKPAKAAADRGTRAPASPAPATQLNQPGSGAAK